MTDGGGFVLPIPPAVVLWTKGEISMLATEKHPTARFFELQRHFIRSSLPEIPSRPFRTIHRGEGMTDGGGFVLRIPTRFTAAKE
jgi:hypothetical protein